MWGLDPKARNPKAVRKTSRNFRILGLGFLVQAVQICDTLKVPGKLKPPNPSAENHRPLQSRHFGFRDLDLGFIGFVAF